MRKNFNSYVSKHVVRKGPALKLLLKEESIAQCPTEQAVGNSFQTWDPEQENQLWKQGLFIIIIHSFCIELFSALEQTHCAH